MTIEVNDKKYNVDVVNTSEDMKKGLQGIKEMPEDEGMLFVFDEPQTVGFWMKDTLIPLDIVFINEDLEVVSIYHGEPNNNDVVEEDNIKYVLEVNSNSGINEGDDVELNQEKDIESGKMLVLTQSGESQMELEGGERIFSRSNTKVLIKQAKRAEKSKSDSDYKRLGKSMFKYLHIQNNSKAEFVEIKD